MEFEGILKLLGSILGGSGGSSQSPGMSGGTNKRGQAQTQQFLEQGLSGTQNPGYRDMSGSGGGMNYQGLMGFLSQMGGQQNRRL